ncbi:hypothetical protein E5C26_05585 [Serratia proteamaculans]|uniref:helix-turn-helix domain-containing protein n=1 Tax=Serratia proteamaculans TaxID=28151 RepID=UPI0010762931|nr:helix-turn-helix domain-containing protein [Serratia proteamaculans]TFZ52677.1 hypothetical protein E5C26_05585 [Serratia proteamaculans]
MRKTTKIYQGFKFSSFKDALSIKGQGIRFEPGEEIVIPTGMIYFLSQGEISISRRGTEHVLCNMNHCVPIGLMELYYENDSLCYQAVKDVTIWALTKDQWESHLHQMTSYASDITKMLTFMLTLVVDTYHERSSQSGYQIVKTMLHRYNHHLESGLSPKEGVASYILARTKLSRSYVFQILSALRSGEYITIDGGKLVAINKLLPENY